MSLGHPEVNISDLLFQHFSVVCGFCEFKFTVWLHRYPCSNMHNTYLVCKGSHNKSVTHEMANSKMFANLFVNSISHWNLWSVHFHTISVNILWQVGRSIMIIIDVEIKLFCLLLCKNLVEQSLVIQSHGWWHNLCGMENNEIVWINYQCVLVCPNEGSLFWRHL